MASPWNSFLRIEFIAFTKCSQQTWGSKWFHHCLDPSRNKTMPETHQLKRQGILYLWLKNILMRYCASIITAHLHTWTPVRKNMSVFRGNLVQTQAVVGTLASLSPAMDLEDKRCQASKHLELWNHLLIVVSASQSFPTSIKVFKESCRLRTSTRTLSKSCSSVA